MNNKIHLSQDCCISGNSRTIQLPQRAHFLKVNSPLKIHNAHVAKYGYRVILHLF